MNTLYVVCTLLSRPLMPWLMSTWESELMVVMIMLPLWLIAKMKLSLSRLLLVLAATMMHVEDNWGFRLLCLSLIVRRMRGNVGCRPRS